MTTRGFFSGDARGFILNTVFAINDHITSSDNNTCVLIDGSHNVEPKVRPGASGVSHMEYVSRLVEEVSNCETFFDMCRKVEEANYVDVNYEEWRDFKAFAHGMYIAGRCKDRF